jgi:hypothetical protein
MKKEPDRQFFFDQLEHQEVIDLLNQQNPINLKYNLDLVDRVQARYPLLDKSQVSLIIRAIFQSWREFLLLGKTINFFSFFFKCRLFPIKCHRNGVIETRIKVKISTPPPLKKIDT